MTNHDLLSINGSLVLYSVFYPSPPRSYSLIFVEYLPFVFSFTSDCDIRLVDPLVQSQVVLSSFCASRLSSLRPMDTQIRVTSRSSWRGCILSHSLTLVGPPKYERCLWACSDPYLFSGTRGTWGGGWRVDTSPSLRGPVKHPHWEYRLPWRCSEFGVLCGRDHGIGVSSDVDITDPCHSNEIGGERPVPSPGRMSGRQDETGLVPTGEMDGSGDHRSNGCERSRKSGR